MTSIFGENRDKKKIKEQEKTIQLLSDKLQNILRKNDKCLNDIMDCEESYQKLREKHNNLKQNSLPITIRNRGKAEIIKGSARRDKANSSSQSSTKGGKSKKNKFRRSKYRITKRNY
tara:strand:+ start:18955 stop:19305 length:351 start_codon:yes stop_codon:yes gene_type:complete